MGAFEFTGLAPGDHVLTANLFGYAAREVPVTVRAGAVETVRIVRPGARTRSPTSGPTGPSDVLGAPLHRCSDTGGSDASQRRELVGGLDWWKRDGYATEGAGARAGTEIACGC